MKNKWLFLLSPSLLLAQIPAPTAASADAAKKMDAPEVMIVSPEARANDYKQAFDLLRKEKATINISFTLQNGTAISNILDMQILDKGTLILFKTNTPRGIQYQVVRVEEIASLAHTTP